MELISFFESKEYKNKVAHFAAIVKMMTTNGSVNAEGGKVIKRFSEKLGIRPEEYGHIVTNPEKFISLPPKNEEEKLERIYQLFSMVYKHHYMNALEQKLMIGYTMQLGYSEESAKKIVDNSARLFMGRLHFREYLKLAKK
ncbi:hypothetical protein [Flagellimonas crocea]|uniref:hypothetical protein n=1 Tax=Flagellimonas crocea TaxID=3067311 RepID=UPI00296EF6EA|nr:hypothetical protein [Muricauda sp. DH64]